MPKITYLLGAGASANVLPLIRDSGSRPGLPTMIKNFIAEYSEELKQKNFRNDISNDLIEIGKMIMKFGTPDLLAKFYLEKGEDRKYNILKWLISCVFLNEETNPNQTGVTIDEQNIDPRVIVFLTTIASQKKIPDNIKIVSWNYDSQLQMGAGMFGNHRSNKILDNFTFWPHTFEKVDLDTDIDDIKDYFLIQINGRAGKLYSANHLSIHDEKPKLFNSDPNSSLLSFAWEDDIARFGKSKFLSKRNDIMKKNISDTEILVVIGYSFPFFNRKIDNIFFETIKPTLKKVYFQNNDSSMTGHFLYNQFNLSKQNIETQYSGFSKFVIDINHIPDCTQYYVPFEL